jgi:aminoglycoside N3'-acetyltransferase
MRTLKIAYFYVAQFLPESVTDRLLAFWMKMTSFLRRWLRKHRSKRRAIKLKEKKAAAIAKYGTFGALELTRVLRESGIQEGDVLFVQISFNDLYTFSGSPFNPMSILSALRDTIGAKGTLLMPAYTLYARDTKSVIFDPTHEPTYTGLVNELFRRIPGVIRSIHPRHSICGHGPMAFQLLNGHEKCIRADGPDSPFDRMRYLPNAKILTLGLPPGFLSFLHWLEDIEPEKLPFPIHEQFPIKRQVKCPDGSIVSTLDYIVKPEIAARVYYNQIAKNLSSNASQFSTYKGVNINTYPMKPLAEELLALRDRGITHRVRPKFYDGLKKRVDIIAIF